MTRFKLYPSILSADFAHLDKQIKESEKCGADGIHIDVMDGQFVPAITFGSPIVEAVRKSTDLPIDIVLMTINPEKHFKELSEAGADSITVHHEACQDLKATLEELGKHSVQKSVAINPATPVESISNVMNMVDQILVMSVVPGAGGQSFIPESLSKIATLSNQIKSQSLTVSIQVDGGINSNTITDTVKNGANILVAGSAVFNKSFSICDGLSKLRGMN
ncbi:MAG: ribulose-phosphate 3-epimerase [Chloroflexota bacterium]|nr:ribulose-phosphate 3-epimerase [Chloroflexota bacterium]